MFRSGGELEIERGRRVPAQIDEKRKAGLALDVGVPLLQALLLALIFTGMIISGIYTLKVFGKDIYWIGVFIWGFGTFIWFLAQATRTTYIDERGEHIGILWTEALTGVIVSLLVGLICYSLWRAMDPHKSTWEAAKKLAPLVFFGSFFPFLFAAFMQELLYRSPFFEQHMFHALGDIWTWKAKQPKPRTPVRHIYHPSSTPKSAAAKVAESRVDPITEEEEEDWHGTLDLLEFLVGGQRVIIKDKGGNPRLLRYSRRQWRGMHLSSGTRVTEPMVKRWTKELSTAGILQLVGSEFDLAPGLALGEALRHISVQTDTPIPMSMAKAAELVDRKKAMQSKEIEEEETDVGVC